MVNSTLINVELRVLVAISDTEIVFQKEVQSEVDNIEDNPVIIINERDNELK